MKKVHKKGKQALFSGLPGGPPFLAPVHTGERRYPPCTFGLLPAPPSCWYVRFTSPLAEMGCGCNFPQLPSTPFSLLQCPPLSLPCQLGCIPADRPAHGTRIEADAALISAHHSPCSGPRPPAPIHGRATQAAGQPRATGHLGPA